jgi:hypothetical protein
MAIVPEQPTDTAQATAASAPAPPAATAFSAAPPPVSAAPASAPTPAPTGRLHPAVWRLILMAVLFVGWMGYLFYLVRARSLTSAGTPLVVSRAQVLVSDVDVIAHIDNLDPNTAVTVKQVLWPTTNAPVHDGDPLLVTNLKDSRPFAAQSEEGGPLDFTGPGDYLLLLHRIPDSSTYQVVPIPPSPGYPPAVNPHKQGGRPRIYPATPDVLAQYRASAKPIKEEGQE